MRCALTTLDSHEMPSWVSILAACSSVGQSERLPMMMPTCGAGVFMLRCEMVGLC